MTIDRVIINFYPMQSILLGLKRIRLLHGIKIPRVAGHPSMPVQREGDHSGGEIPFAQEQGFALL